MLTLKPDHLPLKKDERILDLGCGDGRHLTGLLELNLGIHLVGLDINPNDIESARSKISIWHKEQSQNTTLIQGDGLQLPFNDSSFDHIICSEVLEHIHDYQIMLGEIKRVLKKGGHLCVSVPRAWPEKICWYLSKEYHEVEGGHIRIFKAKALKQQISALGLSPYKRHWAHALHSPFWWLKCLFWKQKEDSVLVRAYHKILVWDLMKKPLLTQALEKILNPICGKSLVLYFKKQ